MKTAIAIIMLVLPMAPTFWAIVDIAYKDFGTLQRKGLWVAFVVLFPVIGGIVYIFAGRKQGTKIVTQNR